MTELRIAVDGCDADLESLWDWLGSEPELRGHVRANRTPVPIGGMGAPVELLVTLAASGVGAASLLARSLLAWLTQREVQRRADVSITVIRSDGRKVSLNAKRVLSPDDLLRQLLGEHGNDDSSEEPQ